MAEDFSLDRSMTLKGMIRRSGHLQGWVAEQLGMSPAFLTRIVTGRKVFPISQIAPFAVLMDVPVEDVLTAISETPRRTKNGESSTQSGSEAEAEQSGRTRATAGC